MKIILDADAMPKVVREILYRAAERLQLKLILVANQAFSIPQSAYISFTTVEKDPDAADKKVLELTEPGDLIITQDIPLADRILEKGGQALSPRGELFTLENIKTRLSTRDLLEMVRNSGEITGGPSAYRPKDRQAFANQLDRLLNISIQKR